MPDENKQQLKLHELHTGLPALTRPLCEYFAEAAAVCLENQNHSSGVKFAVTGEISDQFDLFWPSVTIQARASHNDLQDATEIGAYAIAFLITREYFGYTVIERSKKGTGFDFWLGSPNDPLFQKKARLEVSGILQGDIGEIDKRVRIKIKQTDLSDKEMLPAHVVVVEFGAPTSKAVCK